MPYHPIVLMIGSKHISINLFKYFNLTDNLVAPWLPIAPHVIAEYYVQTLHDQAPSTRKQNFVNSTNQNLQTVHACGL